MRAVHEIAAALFAREVRRPCRGGRRVDPRSLAASGLLLVLTLAGADAQQAAPQACFSEAALASQPNERLIQRGNRAFDHAPPTVALAPPAPLAPEYQGSIRSVALPPGRKLIALTFDFCETPGEVAGYDGAIFDYLRSQHVKATLFLGGKWMLSHRERAEELMTDPLFEIGSHGYAHRNVRGLSGQGLVDELVGPSLAYAAIKGEAQVRACLTPGAAAQMSRKAPADGIRLMRFPYGTCNPAALQAAAEHGLLAIQWSLGTGDPAPTTSAAAIAHAMVSEVKPGAIIINHGNGRGWHTAEAMPLAIPKLKAMGYEFVTVSELIAAGRPVTASSCYETHPGDLDHYDFLFAHASYGPLPPDKPPVHKASPDARSPFSVFGR